MVVYHPVPRTWRIHQIPGHYASPTSKTLCMMVAYMQSKLSDTSRSLDPRESIKLPTILPFPISKTLCLMVAYIYDNIYGNSLMHRFHAHPPSFPSYSWPLWVQICELNYSLKELMRLTDFGHFLPSYLPTA